MFGDPIPDSLAGEGLLPVWENARRMLDRNGTQWRGTVALPALDPISALALESLLGRLTRRVDLAELEAALVALKAGVDLSDALTRLGRPPSLEAAQRRADRDRSQAARAALRSAVESWDEPWATEWADAIVKAGLLSGLDSGEVEGIVGNVRALLDRLDQAEPPGTSRTELAAGLFGSSHALDRGTRLASLVTYALNHRINEPLGESLELRELWDGAGILADRVSAPVLAWSLPAVGDSPLDEMVRAAANGGLPLHVSLLALLRHPVTVPSGTRVLVVENPRLVEAAAERRLTGCVVAANGNPTTSVTTLLRQMRQSGASICYHGDFDAAGIAICRRMHALGYTPQMMDASDYTDAVRLAEVNGVQLDRDGKDCGPTPWDPALRSVFENQRLMIHEEFVLDRVLNEFSNIDVRPIRSTINDTSEVK